MLGYHWNLYHIFTPIQYQQGSFCFSGYSFIAPAPGSFCNSVQVRWEEIQVTLKTALENERYNLSPTAQSHSLQGCSEN